MKKLLTAALLCCAAAAHAQNEITVPVSLLSVADGNQVVGEVRISQSKYGAVFTPKIRGLAAGIYGFHVHEKPSCEAAEKDGKKVEGLGAGGH
ncbi:superoxide dismutase family protein [Neisseria chenwenguii]|uniref:superoxide dismutase family protein n=1 Tax=Neisseria chenwenguii TaxID=1853278 RepID=UPI001E5DA5C1|nr:superoxide dismutase family protein [Neisseria chenwenguii]